MSVSQFTTQSAWSMSDQQLTAALSRQQRSASSREMFEVVLVQVSGQPFALLMSQLFNIVRPGSGGLKVLREVELNGLHWYEIEQRSQQLPVLALADVLYLPKSKPLESSEILLSGYPAESGILDMVFGVATDEVVLVRPFRHEDLRPVPNWVYRKKLGNLVIGALLVERELLASADVVLPPAPAKALSPNFGADANTLNSNSAHNAAKSLIAENSRRLRLRINQVVNSPRPDSAFSSGYQQQVEQDKRRPVLLLNLDVINRRLFPEQIKAI